MQTPYPELTQETLLILGCGDIGRRLGNELSKELSTYSVIGVRRNFVENTIHNLKMIQADLTQAAEMKSILAATKPNLILITMTPGERSDEAYQRTYVQTCQNLIENLRLLNQKPRLILFVSSTSVYAQDDGSWVNESSVTEPENFSGKRLLEAEAVLRDSRLPVCIVRFSGIYGPGRDRLIMQVRSRKLSASAQLTNRIHADDCARVLAHLMERQKISVLDKIYLASDDCPVPLNQVHAWMAEKLAIQNTISIDATNERSNKKISNQRLKETGFNFSYPTYKQGYSVLIDQTS